MSVLYSQRRAGITSEVRVEPGERRPGVLTRQDVSPILADNARERNVWNPAMQRNPGRFRKIASIPLVVMPQLVAMGICEMTRAGGFRVVDERRLLLWLSDRDQRQLRTDNGARLA